jgi:hypothetical protein
VRESEQLPVTFFWLLLSYTLITTCWLLLVAGGERDAYRRTWLLFFFFLAAVYKIEMKKKEEEEEEEFSVCPLRASWWATISPFLKDTLNIDPGLSPIYLDAFYADQSEYEHNSWPAQLVLSLSSLALSPEPLWLYTNRTSKQQQELSGSTWGNRRPAESVWSGETPAEERERERIIISKASE